MEIMGNNTLLVILLLCCILQGIQSQYIKPELPTLPIRHPNCPEIDDPANPAMLFYPNDCTRYYICTAGLAYVNACPANLYWSQISKRCDLKQLSSCAFATSAASFPPTTTNSVRPECASLTYSMHPANGNHFYEICERVCAPNSQWNMAMQRCEPLAAANWDYLPVMPNPNAALAYATATLTPTMPYTPASAYVPAGAWPPATSLLPQAPLNPASTAFVPQIPFGQAANNSTFADSICQASQQIYISYPGDCTKFIHCDYRPFVKSCPPFLYWNSKLSTCDKVCI